MASCQHTKVLFVAYFGRGKECAQQTGAQTRRADFLLLSFSVVCIFKKLDLMKNESWETLKNNQINYSKVFFKMSHLPTSYA